MFTKKYPRKIKIQPLKQDEKKNVLKVRKCINCKTSDSKLEVKLKIILNEKRL